MKNVIEAVKYGMETLKVSPNEMFSLIESSKGYSGDDYKRWLANEIIKISEKEGIGYSQLLVKRLAIVSAIMENVNVSIKPEWVKVFKKYIGCDNIISVNFEEVGGVVEGLDWYSGVDLMFDRAFSDKLPELGGDYCFVGKLESDSCDKSSDLVKFAKEHGIVARNKGSLLLLRMCNYVESNELSGKFRFAFFVNTGFLYDMENSDVISFFLRYFNYKGFVVDSSELLTDVSHKNQYAFVVCEPRGMGAEYQECFVLPEKAIRDNKLVSIGVDKRYSRSNKSALETLNTKGNVYGELRKHNNTLKAYTVRGDEYTEGIPITNMNFREAVVIYSVWWSMRYCGFSTDIKELLTGSQDFYELYYNCLPLFLFNSESYFEGEDNIFDVLTSDFIKSELEKAEVHLSYEAKELLSVCKGYLEFCGEDARGKVFETVRLEANHEGLNNAYILAISKLKEYICSLYRRVG